MSKSIRSATRKQAVIDNRLKNAPRQPGLGTLSAMAAVASKPAGGIIKISPSQERRNMHLQEAESTREMYIRLGYIKPVQ
jgi:hypothetical protein